MSATLEQQPLEQRVSELERQVSTLKRDTGDIRRDLAEQGRLIRQSLPQMQERIDHLEAVLIDENEKTRKAFRDELREFWKEFMK